MSLLPLTLKAVCVKRRGKLLLGPVDLQLDGAGITIVLGPNGAGKTTLLKVMHGVERLSSGDIHWAASEADARAAQAYVFQTPVMLRRSVRDNLAYPLALRGVARAQSSARVEHWAERIGLSDALDRAAPRLSGGEKQKLALARALIVGPELLFLDEPCANLDGNATREIEALLSEAAAAGTRIVMATHNLGQARRLARNVVFMLAGTVLETGEALEMFDNPKSSELAAFLKGDIVG